ncbi:Spy/CpxP family protein refolding chaperone [Arcobacter arenosus]|uniref:Spy/CpxP family protein refolding chaperone n=1 Tax=Arcobacter arenosus TaxID=2576037 RepID=UPI003BACB137
MKRKILATVALTTLLGTGLYAAGCNFQGQGMPGMYGMQGQGMQGMKGHGMQGMKGMQGNKSCGMSKKGSKGSRNSVMNIFRKLNLSSDQYMKMAQIRQEVFKKYANSTSVAFTKDSFDKTKYIELMKQKRDNMIESKAEIVEKSYALLTPEQKEQFKVLLDLREERRNTMMQNRPYMRKGMNF